MWQAAGLLHLVRQLLRTLRAMQAASGSRATSSLQTDGPAQSASDDGGGKDLEQLEAEIQAVEDRVKNAQNTMPVIDTASPDVGDTGEEIKPRGLSKARDGKADDLKQISGVGPKLETTLNSLGVFHYDQIAVWNRDNISWVDNYLSFKGRIDREDWIGQAQTLATALADKKGDA